MQSPTYEVVWPLGRSAYETVPLVPRARDLSGKTVCEVWEYSFRGDEVFAILRELLSNRYPGIKFVDYRVFGDTHGPKEKAVIAALPGLLRENACDAVISALGA
ncbi:MAG: hypothetical protein HYX92_15820 [Chloroflexi bacterium]|nr:hypothetical protein [Chloroflexota bacterium]